MARRLGGRRTGALGRSAPDVLTPSLSVEVKHRRRLPSWLKEALGQARRGAGERLPLVVLHEHGAREDMALLYLRDLERLLGVAHPTRRAPKPPSRAPKPPKGELRPA
ncbi:MAG TPA: hypothetical protein VNL95_06420 [Dehalococcoidia bacterium]|nr:hypothetical protein [Dehalococcoidia bacterium]